MTEAQRADAGRGLPARPAIAVPFTTRTRCLLFAPAQPDARVRPPLLVVLHGMGQDAERQVRWMGAAVPAHFAAAFPDGFHRHEVRKPDRPIRLGHAWYMYTGDQPAFAASLAESEHALWQLVDAAVAATGADPARVWLAGFSQGAYLVHCAAARAPGRVAGWIAQSGRFKTEFLGESVPGLAGKPVLIQHGRHDAALQPEAAERSAAALRASGARVELSLHEAGHAITPGMAAEARSFLERCEPRLADTSPRPA